jgi:colicin import membrane protein
MRHEPASYTTSLNFDHLNVLSAQATGPNRPPRDGSFGRSFGLALGAHAFLVLMLVIGTRWTTSTPAAIEAELWAPLPREAAPRQAQPPPAPQPEPPQEKPQEKAPPPPPPQTAQEDRDAEIALEKKKKEEEQRKTEAEEKKKAEAEEKKKLEQEKKLEDEKKALEEEKKREAQEKKEAEQKAKLEKQKAAEAAQKRQDEFTKQLMAQAGTGAPTASGTAEKSAGPRGDASYAALVVAAVRANTVYDEASVEGNNPAVFRVELLPDGTPAEITLTKSSGDSAFDSAVERGIRKTNPFPRPTAGVYPKTLEIIYRPRK